MRGRLEASTWLNADDLRILDRHETSLEFRHSKAVRGVCGQNPESMMLSAKNNTMDSGLPRHETGASPE